MSRFKKIGANLLLFLFAASFTVMLFEAGLRFTKFKGMLTLTTDGTPRYYFKADPVTGIDIRENFPESYAYVPSEAFKYEIWSNELGCFDRPYDGERDYMLLVGDSFAQYFAPFEDKWGTRIEALLGYRVVKAGVAGYGTRHEYIKAKRIISKVNIAPRLIIIGYYLNDLRNDFEFPELTSVNGYVIGISNEDDMEKMVERWERYGIPGEPRHPRIRLVVQWLRRHSILFNMAKTRLKKLMLSIPGIKDLVVKEGIISPMEEHPHIEWAFKSLKEDPRLRKYWEDHFVNLREFKEFARQNGSELLMVVIPKKEQVYPFLLDGYQIDLERPNRILRDFFDKEGFLYIDLLPFFKKFADRRPKRRLNNKSDLYWRHDLHWNINGNHLAGLLVARYILERGLLDVNRRNAKLKDINERLENFNIR